MVRISILASILLNVGLLAGVSRAQPGGGPPTAREPARIGILGGLREAREERFRKEAQAAIDAARAAELRNAAGLRNAAATKASPLIPASASAVVPNPVRYSGPGVVIRLPKEARGLVNYLVDDVELKTIRPSEEQWLKSKGSYIVRYSRGVTADGRSFGESRYTITEGRYRFELSQTGWELYRESGIETRHPPANPLDFVESSQVDEPLNAFPRAASQSQSLRVLSSESLATDSLKLTPTLPNASQPVTSQPVASEEVLPAPKPRSILE